jgi:hypothetical protein
MLGLTTITRCVTVGQPDNIADTEWLFSLRRWMYGFSRTLLARKGSVYTLFHRILHYDLSTLSPD